MRSTNLFMRIRSHNRKAWHHIKLHSIRPQLRQQQQSHKKRRYDINGYGTLHALKLLVRRHCDPGILNHDIQSLQLRSFGAELPHALVGAQIDVPDLDFGVAFGGLGDQGFGGEAFRLASTA